MLEKNKKNYYYDAHFHFSNCIEEKAFDFFNEYNGCSCFFSKDEFNFFQKSEFYNTNIISAYGLHPQSANLINVNENLDFLEKLLFEKKIKAVGEAGFDFFLPEFRETEKIQTEIWEKQLALSIKFQIPLIIHCRKANEKLFEYAKQLSRVPSVLFHSFMGSETEALSLLRKGINGYFSFGKQILNNNKKVISCTKNLPIEVLLLETDAPFQFLKGEEKTYISEIKKIYSAAYSLRPETEDFIEFENAIAKNFKKLFYIS